MTATRYWERVGFRITLEQGHELISRMDHTGAGKVLDDDVEEFVAPDTPTPEVLAVELESLFSLEDDGRTISDDNAAIISLMTFEQGRKKFIMDLKAEGLTLEEAKETYENAKAKMVREHLGLPDPETEEE
jgi:formate-dependent phosphoribosylglycinamide formyltransferase (GAR transformylase)